jgi:hypothetical protein
MQEWMMKADHGAQQCVDQQYVKATQLSLSPQAVCVTVVAALPFWLVGC